MLSAWDPVTQTERWFAPGGGSNGGGALATAGNLVFQSLNDGRLMAYSADKGEKLLELPTGHTSGMGPPVTYLVDGTQYVALMGGQGTVVGGRGGNPANSTPVAPRLYAYTLTAQPLPDSQVASPTAPASSNPEP